MTQQVQLDLYEMHTGRRGTAGARGGRPRRSPAAVGGSRRGAGGGRRRDGGGGDGVPRTLHIW